MKNTKFKTLTKVDKDKKLIKILQEYGVIEENDGVLVVEIRVYNNKLFKKEICYFVDN